MIHADKIEKLKKFDNEKDFRLFLIDLLKKMGFTDVFHTHRYGSPELGKDIIANIFHQIEGTEMYAFVVKLGKIKGGSTEIETIKAQIKQSFEYPYEGINGERLRVNKVRVITNDNFTQGAQTTIGNSIELRMYSNIDYWWNEKLIEKIDNYYSDFWLPGDEFSKEYSKELKKVIQEEFELKDLSFKKIEDKKVRRLIDIFIAPNITESTMETAQKEGADEKIMVKKRVSLQNLMADNKNLIITGEAGSGKTKVSNTLICEILNSKKIAEEKILPVKLKGKEILEADFNIDQAVIAVVKKNAPDTYSRIMIDEYEKIIFVDEIDVLAKVQKKVLFNNLKKYTKDKNRFIITQRKNDNIDLDATTDNFRTVRINNFNLKQIQSFIEKYFEGSGKGEKFIQILKEGNLFSKLPTTPLTITLISLLYDENGYEIPATLTDIYNDFTDILFGKLEVRSRKDLLLLNIKKRLFTHIALKLLDEKRFDLTFEEFKSIINKFLDDKGYQQQSDEELIDIIFNSGVLYIDHTNLVGFKQQAFIEYLASIEIYDHKRKTHYPKLLENFNDVSWQNTAIFFAGKSKDYPEMVNDLLTNMPNENIQDWLINTAGMGYLCQALYLTDKVERKKLILKALDNLELVFAETKKLTSTNTLGFKDLPLPLLATILDLWFIDNFKSITLKQPLNEVFNELAKKYENADINDFFGDFKLLLVASTLAQKNINDQEAFLELIGRDSFIKNPVLMVAGDFYLRIADIEKNTATIDVQKKVSRQIKNYIKALKNILKEPAHRFDEQYRLLPKPKVSIP